MAIEIPLLADIKTTRERGDMVRQGVTDKEELAQP